MNNDVATVGQLRMVAEAAQSAGSANGAGGQAFCTVDLIGNYGIDIYSTVMGMAASGMTEYVLEMETPGPLAQVSDIIKAGRVPLFDIYMGDSGLYRASVSGMSMRQDGSVYWVDLNLTAYAGGIGWISATIGFDKTGVLIQMRTI